MSRYYIIRGQAFGDEGKGSIVDFISQTCSDVVKDGGPQAAHHIISRNGKLHRSEQMSSGVFNAGVRTFGSKDMYISPDDLIQENLMLHLAGIHDGMKRFSIDSRCPVVTPLHQMIGRLKETSRGKNKHGSTGKGVGEAVRDRIKKGDEILTVADLADETVLKEKIESSFAEKFQEAKDIAKSNLKSRKLSHLYKYYRQTMSSKVIFNNYRDFAETYASCIVEDGESYFSELLKSGNNLVFEGAQGALLDPEYGFIPYVTKTKTTFEATTELLDGRAPRSQISKIGVMRAYGTRHGAGPFVTENKNLARKIPDMHNGRNPWQGKFRIGWFDLLAARYGIAVNGGLDSIALTNLDRLSELNKILVCTSYEYLGSDEGAPDEFFEWENLGASIRITGFKKPKKTNENISRILSNCAPLEFEKFPGWKRPIEGIKDEEDLPKEARKYINYLQSELGETISIVSVGPTSEDKIQLNPC